MPFVDKTFFDDIRPAASGGPMYKTTIKQLRGGGESRNELWADPLRRFIVSLGARDTDLIFQLYDFVANTSGAANPFRLKDWSDYKSCLPQQTVADDDQSIGTGDGLLYYFRLTKLYGDAYLRRILKPRNGTVIFALDGTLVGPTEGYVDYDNGVVVFKDAPTNGQAITAGFEFDTPVRFSEDATEVLLLFHKTGMSSDINLQEVRVRENIDTDAYDITRALL